MALKTRKINTPDVSITAAEKLASELADRPYGINEKTIESDTVVRTSITLPQSMLNHIEDMAFTNKRAGEEPKTVSAIIREALSKYIEFNIT